MIKPMLSLVALLSLVVFSFFYPETRYISVPLVYFFQVLLVLQLTCALRTFSRAWNGLNKFSKAALIIQILLWTTVALLHHPGFVDQDTFRVQNMLTRDFLSPWFAVAYTLIVKLFFDLDPSLFLFLFFHIFIFITCVFKCFKISQPQSWLVVIAITMLTGHPLIQASALFLTRDVLFCLLSVYLVLCFGERYFNRIPMDFSFLAHVVLVTFLLSGMRQEALLYVAAFPLLIFQLGGSLSAVKKGVTCGALVLAALAWNLSLNGKTMAQFAQLSQKYQLTGIVHQLNYLVFTQHDKISPAQKAVISKVVNYDTLVKNYLPDSIGVLRNGGFTTLPVAEEDWEAFLSTYRELVFTYPADFLRERTDLFTLTLSLTGEAYVYPDGFDMPSESAEFVKKTYGLKRWNLVPELTALHSKYLNSIYFRFANAGWVANFFTIGSPLLLLLLSIAAVLFCRKSELTRFMVVASAFCYSRIPAVFFLAAEPDRKYYAIFIYFPVFMITLAVLLYRPRAR